MKGKLRAMLLVVCALTFAVAAVGLVREYLSYRAVDTYYSDLQEAYVRTEPTLATRPTGPPTGDGLPPTASPAAPPIAVDFERLLRRNGDVVGWLCCPDTVINYPVVQAKDNQTYLHTDLDGNDLRSGTLFADYRNGAVGEDANLLIYGHDMYNRSMFGSLSDYQSQAYYDAHPCLYYLTPAGDYRIDLFAGVTVDTGADIYCLDAGETDFSTYLNKLRAVSTFRSAVTLGPEERVVTLSTCSYESEDARYVVVGKLVPLPAE